MNVFILGTGRCGSTTFIAACKHIANFTAGHETRTMELGTDRLAYPGQHIEADNRLSWFLGRLDKKYGDTAHYVHLKRDSTETAKSYMQRYWTGIMRAYRGNGILMGFSDDRDPLAVCLDYCDTVTSNIESFLKDKTHVMEIHLESIEQDFPRFWDWIQAEGDRTAALGELRVKHNRRKERSLPLRNRIRSKVKRMLWGYLMRLDEPPV